jgi:surfactin synthase thioesterase subunit
MSDDGDRWVVAIRPAEPAARLRLICLAYAGGSPDMFRAWSAGVAPDVELLTLRLPGHGKRIKEKPYQHWDTLVADVYAALAPYLAAPHAFYGHSFGGRLAYELVHRAKKDHLDGTRRLFVSGCRSPDVPQVRPYMHELDLAGFCDALRHMGGTPAEFLDTPGVRDLLLPVVREEIRLAELWTDWHGQPVDVPITAMYGIDDPVDTRAAMSGWASFTTRGAELLEMPGGHFFPDTHLSDLLKAIDRRIGAGDG